MDTKDEFASVTLMILGDDLEPDDVSSRLELEASRTWRCGEEKSKAKGTYYDWGGWKGFNEDRDARLEEQIEHWMNKLHGKSAAFDYFRSKGWRCSLDVFLAFEDVSTINLPNELISRISDLGLNMDVSLHAGCEYSQ